LERIEYYWAGFSRAGAFLPETDADLHFEGTGDFAWGTKWVIMAARGANIRHRIILDVAPVPDKGGEAATAVASLERLVPALPGVQGVVYDTALRGVHHQRIMRHLGVLSINRVTASKAGAKKPRRTKADQRQDKSVLVETKTIGTIGAFAAIAMWNAPFLKVPSFGVGLGLLGST